MQIRLTGTREECRDFAAVLPDLIADWAQVREVSGFYPNRGASLLGRLYLDVTPLPAGSTSTPLTMSTHGGAR